MREATPAPAVKPAEAPRPLVRMLPYELVPNFSIDHPASRKAVFLQGASTTTFPPHMFQPSAKRAADEGFEAYKMARRRLLTPDGLITLDNSAFFFVVCS